MRLEELDDWHVFSLFKNVFVLKTNNIFVHLSRGLAVFEKHSLKKWDFFSIMKLL